MTKTISIVVPAYNEEDVIQEFHNRLVNVVGSLNFNIEIIYINDGSRDSTLELLNEIRQDDPRVGIIDLSRNFGKEIALTAGLDNANGNAVIVIDADLQDPPELIPEMCAKWKDGYDVVSAMRMHRAGETRLKKVTAYLFYRLMKRLADINLPEDTGDFRLLSRRAVDAVTRIREQHRFMKGIFSWVGFKQTSITYERDPRYAGDTKWSYWKLWNLAIEGITSFTTLPLKISMYIGGMTALFSLIYGIFIVLRTFLYGTPVPGYPSMLVVILFLGGVQLMTLGVIGEYLGRIFNETKQRPLYFIKELYPVNYK